MKNDTAVAGSTRGEFSIPIAKKMKLSEVREAQAMAEAGGISKILLIP
ncbi:MAG: hypothetical protein ABI076_03030 [Acidobacteriaceae bacterium]